MKHRRSLIILLLAGLLISAVFPSTAHAQTPAPVVRVVLFYSPDCPHCHYVITETLPPLLKKYGIQLQIMSVDVNQPAGMTLFLAAIPNPAARTSITTGTDYWGRSPVNRKVTCKNETG